MKRLLKITTVIAAIIVFFVGLLFIAAEYVLNSSAVKSQIENIVSEALDMSFEIEGKINVDFFPFLSVVVNDVSVSTVKGKIASADHIEIDPHLLELVFLKVHFENVDIENPQLTFDPHVIDKILELTGGGFHEPLPFESLIIESFSISKGKFFYSDAQSVVDFNEMNFDGGRITIIEDQKVIIDDVISFFEAVKFKGDVSASQIISQDFKLANFKAKVKDEKGILTFDPVELDYLGSAAKLRATLDLTQEKPLLESQLSISGLNIEKLAQLFYLDLKMTGKLDFSAKFSVAAIEMNKLVEWLQAMSQSEKLIKEEVFPVNKFTLKSYRVSANNLGIAEDTIKLDRAIVELTGGSLSLIEKNRLTINDLEAFLHTAKFHVKAKISNLVVKSEKFSDIRFAMQGNQGILESDSMDLEYFGARTKIAGFLNVQDRPNRLKVRIEMPEVDLKKSFEKFELPCGIQGIINLIADLEASAASIPEMFKNAKGNLLIKGQNLTLKDVDLDKALDEFEKIRGYGFNDLAALVLLGPLGTIVSHGYDQLDSIEKIMKASGDSTIQQATSDWKIANSALTATDVAFSTKRHRVAVKGILDLPYERFVHVTFALVDQNGCMLDSETVNGPFKEPVIEGVNLIQRTLIRPLKKLLNPNCKFFYDGSVPHPTGE